MMSFRILRFFQCFYRIDQRIVFRSFASSGRQIDVEDRKAVRIIHLNRPDKLNALSTEGSREILTSLREVDDDPSLKVSILTGRGKAFCAGADLEEMSTWTQQEAIRDQKFYEWIHVHELQKPLIGAVNGLALGSGCELAMLCDILIASEKAIFSQPEVNLALIPGMGGTQRLPRAVGKSKAMELLLTGDLKGLTAEEAKFYGVVSRVVPHGTELDEALQMAEKIAQKSSPAIIKAKKCVNRAFEEGLTDSLKYEIKQFWSCFDLEDSKEGMDAFLNKRPPNYKDK